MDLRDIPAEAYTATFLPTRYFGSKRKQIVWLANELKTIRGSTAIDPFGGTGTVSAALGFLGFKVAYCDIFRFNEISARAIFKKTPLQIEKHIEFLGAIRPHKSFVAKQFAGKFFTDTENEWLDGFAKSIANIDPTRLDKDALFYAIFQACLKKRPYNLFHRANLNLRISAVPKTFGNWYSWRKSFVTHASQALAELGEFRKHNSGNVRILKSRCATQHSGYYDLIYVDPPYFKDGRGTDSYLQRYHFLEGLSQYSIWPELVDKTSSIGQMHKRHFNNEWNTADDLMLGLHKIMSKIDSRAIAISYAKSQMPSLETLQEIVFQKFKKVRVSHHSTSTALSKVMREELLIIGEGRR